MVKTYTTSDGISVDFPDNASQAEIQAGLRQAAMSPEERAAQADARRRASSTLPITRALQQGFTLHYGDEIDGAAAAAETATRNAFAKAGIGSPAGYSPRNAFNAVMDAEQEAYSKANPMMNLAGEFVGAAANPITRVAGKWIAAAQSMKDAAHRAMPLAAGIGAVSGVGAGSSPEERVQGGVLGGEVGAGFGLIAPTMATRVIPPVVTTANSFLERLPFSVPRIPLPVDTGDAYSKMAAGLVRSADLNGEKEAKRRLPFSPRRNPE